MTKNWGWVHVLCSAYHQLSPSWEARQSKKWRGGRSDQNKTAIKVAQVFNLGLGWCIVWKFLKAKRLVSWNCEEMPSFFGDKSQIDISSFDTLCQFTWYPMCSEPKKYLKLTGRSLHFISGQGVNLFFSPRTLNDWNILKWYIYLLENDIIYLWQINPISICTPDMWHIYIVFLW